MLGAGMQFNRNHRHDQFYIPAKMKRNYNHNSNNNNNNNNNKSDENQENPIIQRTQSDGVNETRVGWKCRGINVFSGDRELENNSEDAPKPASSPAFEPLALPLSNLERFLQAITPSVHAQYLSKTTLRGLKTCDVEYQPYFLLSDLWNSFKEWSAYGAGVPLVLNGSDSVVQYYVPFLSGIQLYIDPSKPSVKSRRTSEDSDGEYFSRESSSDGSSDSDRDRTLKYSRGQQNPYSLASDISLKMERLLSRDQHTASHEGFSSDEGESGTSQGSLLFQYFEYDPPFSRVPLANKISDLALQIPELKSLRSCDLLSSSWFSVAWYPIYRIPMGPTLKDLDACFLTYHSLYTPLGDSSAQSPVVICPNESDGVPRISLPIYGLSSYKFRVPLWTSTSGKDGQLVNSLLQAADCWLRLLQVNHPDYLFFSRNRCCR
ncbi:hypothetical protein RND81_07G038500 [Saponaria officinalis]|uniref:Uncharacterized protein n=1 Tax=Saponaria officinalis TaxID=3572 RepID=A0AAW1JNK4_SAPOF